SHLEAMNAWMRTLRRARTPLSYTQGFHPHPRLAFSAALPSGEETVGDYMDVVLAERIDLIALLERLRGTLPEGFGLLGVQEVDLSTPSLMSLVRGARYTLFFPEEDRETLSARVAALKAAETIPVQRRAKQKRRHKRFGARFYELDIRPMIHHIALAEGDVPAVDLTLVMVEGKPGKPREIVPLLTEAAERVRVLKRDTLLASGK
ncbi:MAG: DUF2344 domain-containing protein, partial [Deltaproteobacteria bacterium]|nr:DUF2344 domain-containing protein [Deltaproteobacteria bacterium]